MEEKFTFFHRGKFSQWAMCNFSVDSTDYNCAEQYMMASKAILFRDWESLDKIMASKLPKEQKALGRKVSNFNEVLWNHYSRHAVYYGNYAKFTQNKQFEKALLETVGTTLVEASPHDRLWGIGLDAGDPRAQKRETWRGKNWLGEVLTAVREDIILGVFVEHEWS